METVVNVVPPIQMAPAPTPAKSSKKSKNGMKVAYVAVVIGYENKDGDVQEVVHEIDPAIYTITKASVEEVAKVEKKKDKETGDLLGFEPTGQHTMTIKLEYHE